jgi:hypothetical protein
MDGAASGEVNAPGLTPCVNRLVDELAADDPDLGFPYPVEFEESIFSAFATGKGEILPRVLTFPLFCSPVPGSVFRRYFFFSATVKPIPSLQPMPKVLLPNG